MAVLSTQVIYQILNNQYQLSNQIKDKLKLELKLINTNQRPRSIIINIMLNTKANPFKNKKMKKNLKNKN